MSPSDWSDFLVVANDLAARTRDEAAARTAISRAYYAAFGAARRHLIRSGVSIPQAGPAHPLVWSAFQATPGRVHRRIANRGRQLLMRRRRADYEDLYPGVWADARQAVIWARRLLDDLASLP